MTVYENPSIYQKRIRRSSTINKNNKGIVINILTDPLTKSEFNPRNNSIKTTTTMKCPIAAQI